MLHKNIRRSLFLDSLSHLESLSLFLTPSLLGPGAYESRVPTSV